MERKLKRQQRTIGALVKIPLEGGYHVYGRILDVEMAFYDLRTKSDLSTEEILKLPVLFITTVYDSAITKGYWEKISKSIPLEEHLVNTPPKYTQDALNPDKYSIVYPDKQIDASKEECKGMEYWSVWTHENIEKRLNDHYQNKPNSYVERMKRGDMYSNNKTTKQINLQNIDKEAV